MSGAVWFTSDLHLGHRLVAAHRGFGTREEPDILAHDTEIAENWFQAVKPNDHVWVLGDIAVSAPTHALALLATLPGTKHLIAGNHDGCHPMHRDAHRRVGAYLEVFASVSSAARRRMNGTEVLLSHFPYHRDRGPARYEQWRLPNRGSWLLHGHTHGAERVTRQPGSMSATGWLFPPTREIHVGLDAWDLKPVHLSTIEKLISEETP